MQIKLNVTETDRFMNAVAASSQYEWRGFEIMSCGDICVLFCSQMDSKIGITLDVVDPEALAEVAELLESIAE